MKTIEKSANEYSERHGFRVPYDGSNNFYDEVDVKASKDGFLAGIEFAEQWIDVNDELPPQDELVLVKFKIVEGCDDITVLELSDENVWHFRGDDFDQYPVTHWRPINRK